MAQKGDVKRAMPIENLPLYVPDLSELCEVIGRGLQNNYKEFSCSVVTCPDLSNDPFNLAASGICGKTRLVDVGGVPNLIPLAKYAEKVYDLQDVSHRINLPGCFILGAGAGSKHVVGVNCEMIPNIQCEGSNIRRCNLVHISKVLIQDDSHMLQSYEKDFNSSTEFGLLANLFCSQGKRDQVIKVHAKFRSGEKNFVSCIRQAIQGHYGTQRPVGMGGVFLIQKGRIKIHVMPDFSSTPLACDNDLNNWLNFYEVGDPFVCFSTFITEDMGLDLRVEHTHGYSSVNRTGGHYHTDVTPDEIEYIGYFSPAEYIYRLDRPNVTHNIGRD